MPELLAIMKSDMERFKTFFHDLVIADCAIEQTHCLINTMGSRFVRSSGGVVVLHHQLEGDNSSLMLRDCVHLNYIGLFIFLSGIQYGIKHAVFHLVGGGWSSL